MTATLTGKRSRNWQGGRHKHSTGHVIVHAPDDQHARSGGYALEHRLVMAQHIGRPLKRGEVVHHINGDQTDNRIENLMLTTQSGHMKEHVPKTGRRNVWVSLKGGR